MNENEQIVWGQPINFLDFVLGFLAAPNQRRVEFIPKADLLKFYVREKVASPSQDLGEIRDANKERVNKSLSNYASNNFLLSTSNIRPDLNGRYNPGLGLFAGDLTALTLSMGFDPFNASNYYKVATLIPKFRNWGLTRLLADELNNEVRIAGELGKNVGNVPTNTNNLFRATVYKGGEITDPYSTFFTTDPKYASNYGKVTPYTFESKNVVKTTEPLMGYSDPVNMDMFVYNNTKSNPKATAIIGNDKVTGEFIPSLGIEILSLAPRNFTLKSVLEPKTSLRFFERPLSRISEAERAGVPKGERNLPELKRPFIDSNLKNWRESLSSKISKDIDKVDPIDVKKLGENDLSFANRKYSTKLYLLEKNNRESSVFSTKPVDDIKQYTSLLEAVDPRFLNDNGLLSFYIRDYRLYLNDLGYKAGDLTDTEIAKLLTDQYNTLSSTLTGKLKGLVVFHSGPNFFDAFDYSMTGSNTGNMGYLGPGNYFSTEPSVYGSKGNFSTQRLIGKYRYPRRLPYLITNIKSTPVSRELRKTGIVPEYTSPPREVYTNDIAKLNYIQSYIKPLIDATKPRDMAILDDISVYPHKVYTKNNLIEFNVPRNTGIKSLFPHPSSFIKDANGKIIINRNWSDPRINFKFGGKIIGQFKSRNK